MPRVERYAGSAAAWDAFVRAQHGWTHFHLFGWQTVIARVHGHECLYLAARAENGDLEGVLPLVRVRSIVFGHFLVSMPFVNYGGPLGTDTAIVALMDRATRMAQDDGARLLEIRSRVELPIAIPASHRKITVVLELPADPAVLWKQLDAKVRSQVRRPQKEGITVRFGREELSAFHAIFARHMRDLGTPAQPRALFAAIADAFPEESWFACAYHQGRPIAGACGLRWGEELEITWASALAEHKRLAANMLLYWSCMERAALEGVRLFNFGRCTPNGGTHRFKTQWGGRDEPLWWYDVSKHPDVRAPSPDGSFSWGPRLWKRLPPSVATALGPHIVRYIP